MVSAPGGLPVCVPVRGAALHALHWVAHTIPVLLINCIISLKLHGATQELFGLKIFSYEKQQNLKIPLCSCPGMPPTWATPICDSVSWRVWISEAAADQALFPYRVGKLGLFSLSWHCQVSWVPASHSGLEACWAAQAPICRQNLQIA